MQWLPTCSCKQVLLQKGIIVGRKIGIKAAISEDTISYLQCFWSTMGIMTTENSQLFQTSVQGFSFWMRHGKEFCVGDSVVVELDEPYEGHMWTCKAKITNFSSMNSMVTGEFFSKASTTIRQHQHHHLLWLSNTAVLAWLFYNHIHNNGLGMTSNQLTF